jgi:hypothetical protein
MKHFVIAKYKGSENHWAWFMDDVIFDSPSKKGGRFGRLARALAANQLLALWRGRRTQV